jgi:hypothetical protein
MSDEEHGSDETAHLDENVGVMRASVVELREQGIVARQLTILNGGHHLDAPPATGPVARRPLGEVVRREVEAVVRRALDARFDVRDMAIRVASDNLEENHIPANYHSGISNLDTGEIWPFLEAFGTCTRVSRLELAGVRLDSFAAEKLAQALRSPVCGLTSVNLESNSIKEDGLCALADMLRHNSTLRELKLAYQQGIDPSRKAEYAFAEALEYNSTLTKLTLDWHQTNAKDRTEQALQRNVDLLRTRQLALEPAPMSATDGPRARASVAAGPAPCTPTLPGVAELLPAHAGYDVTS